MKTVNECRQRNENQRINNEEDHHQWNSSKMKINDDYQQRKSSHVWNENQHGERQLSKMIITKWKSSYSRWNEHGIVGGMKKWRV